MKIVMIELFWGIEDFCYRLKVINTTYIIIMLDDMTKNDLSECTT